MLDVALRGASAWLAAPRALFDAATSVALLLALVVLARARVFRAVLVVLASAVLVLQLLVFRYYHTPLDLQVVAAAIHAKHDVRPVVLRALPTYALSVAIVAAVQYALVSLAHRALAQRGAERERPLATVLAVASLG
ncbi:unnamed protein product, partial [marine sediment metagenome]